MNLKKEKKKLIEKITLKTGTEFIPGNINILVGPNNSGKSTFLKDISETFGFNRRYHVNTVIKDIEVSLFSEAEAKDYYYKYGKEEVVNRNGTMEYSKENQLLFTDINGNISTYDEIGFIQLLTTTSNLDDRFNFIEEKNTQILDGNSRLNAFSPQELRIRNTLSGRNSNIQKLYRDRSLLGEFSSYVNESLGYYAEILHGDDSMGEISLVGKPLSETERDSLAPDIIDFLENGKLSKDVSDGIKAFIGILLELVAGQAEIILIDEIEAFLHAPLARKLGVIISRIAKDKDKQIFVTTHNTNFIMGCIESHSEFNILRLTYENDVPTSKIIREDEIREIVTNPLLRATRVFEGLFYKNVVVVEADSDRVFYEEINYRLNEVDDPRKIEDCLFINARNKQTVGDIAQLLRKFGIPAVSVIDYDFIKESGKDFTNYLKQNGIPEILHTSIQDKKTKIQVFYKNQEDDKGKLNTIIKVVEEFLESPTWKASKDLQKKIDGQLKGNGWKPELKKEGINFLDEDSRVIAQSLIKELNEYGLFPVYVGEVERWLPEIESSNHGNKWLISKLKNFGKNLEDDDYIKPREGDVWNFIGEIKTWLNNPHRQGMPNK